ncbi:MAG: cation:proton antiporter [Gemmatimonadales bacterium]|nr:cation:proton antiporter [Gemmatimonadales bacterium]
MHDIPILRDLVILVAVAIPVVMAAHRVKIPSLVGFLLTGLVIGPHAFGLIGEGETVGQLAEVGAVLLLFAIGLELELSRVLKLGREVLQGGAVQILASLGVFGLIGLAAGLPPASAVFAGALVAFSSTAIILKVYAQRYELDTAHGRVVVAIAIFQDLAVVPVMLLVPFLAGSAGGVGAALRGIGIGLLPVAGLIVFGRVLVPKMLEHVVRLRNREIFTLCVVFLGLGAAYVTSLFGVSLALGAFIAGLVISESEYGLQALSDILPFRDTFSGIFFTSVGMLLDPGTILREPLLVLGLVATIVVVKAVIAAGAVRSLKRTLATSITAGFGLAQIGEFSFVLAGAGATAGLLNGPRYQLFLAATVLTMLAAPFLIAVAPRVAEWIARLAGNVPLEMQTDEQLSVAALRDHVIIVGYGLNGRNMARALRSTGIAYVILEQHGGVVREARERDEVILFGDGTNPEVLERVGVKRARVIVFCIAAPDVERRGVAVARGLNPKLHIVVRTRYVAAMEELQQLGANEVVPEEFETSLEIFSRVLRRYGLPTSTLRREVASARRGHYEALRGPAPTGHLVSSLAHLEKLVAIETVIVEPNAPAIGENAGTLNLRHQTGATVIAVIRGDAALYTPDPGFRFMEGDAVVLVGVAEGLTRGAVLFRAAIAPE